MTIPLERRIEAYGEFSKLIQANVQKTMVIKQISTNFGLNQNTVSTWYNGKSPYGNRAGRIIRNKELFYVIGALLGDGYTYFWRNTYKVGLIVKDRSFVERFAENLSAVLNRNVKFYHYRKRNLWFVTVQNAELFFLFRKLKNNLSYMEQLLRIGDFRNNSIKFLQGFFDAEGCVKLVKEKTRKTPKVALDVCNKNLSYLKFIGLLFEEILRVNPHFSSQFDERRNSTYHHLRFYKKADVKEILTEMKTIKNRNPQLVEILLA